MEVCPARRERASQSERYRVAAAGRKEGRKEGRVSRGGFEFVCACLVVKKQHHPLRLARLYLFLHLFFLEKKKKKKKKKKEKENCSFDFALVLLRTHCARANMVPWPAPLQAFTPIATSPRFSPLLPTPASL